MLSSDVRSFTDPDDYAAIRQSSAQLTVTGRGYFTGQIIRIDLHRLWMQRFSDNLPRIAHMDSRGGRAVISFGRCLDHPCLGRPIYSQRISYGTG